MADETAPAEAAPRVLVITGGALLLAAILLRLAARDSARAEALTLGALSLGTVGLVLVAVGGFRLVLGQRI